MNQYIIDEEMIDSWWKGCINLSNPHTDDDICKKCKYRGKGWRENWCKFDDNSMEDIFRSHPYNPQFTQDELEDLFIIVDANIERNWKTTKGTKLLDKIEKLRQKDGEPSMTDKTHSFCYKKYCETRCICNPIYPPRCGFGCGMCNCPYCLDTQKTGGVK